MTTTMRHLTPVTDTHIGDTGHPTPRDDDAERAVLGAMLTRPTATTEATGLLTPEDFYRPSHQLIYDTALALAAKGDPVDTITVADALRANGQLTLIGGQTTLHDLAAAAAYGPIDYHAEIIRDCAARRRYADAGMRILAAATTPTLNIRDIAREVVERIDQATGTLTTAPLGTPIDIFLNVNEEDDQPCWLSPGFLERQDRLIVTAYEGVGKSTLLRQIAVQLAAGIHPFTLTPQDPARVVLLDLENSERQIRRKIRPLVITTDINPDNLIIATRPEGIDLTSPQDRAWLDTLLDQTRPDVLIGGPIYKMAGGNPNDEIDAKPAAMALDQARVKYDCALILEAHTKKSPDGNAKNRSKEPFGWSGWLRWPEFGIHLAENGEITHWRGMRDERDFPEMLQRGGRWPWTPVDSPDELLFENIKRVALMKGITSARGISKEMGGTPSHTKINQLITGHFSARWQGVRHRIEGVQDA